jgi:hypothetical protein
MYDNRVYLQEFLRKTPGRRRLNMTSPHHPQAINTRLAGSGAACATKVTLSNAGGIEAGVPADIHNQSVDGAACQERGVVGWRWPIKPGNRDQFFRHQAGIQIADYFSTTTGTRIQGGYQIDLPSSIDGA